MADGIYVAASGALARAQQLELLANNLANLETAGFREEPAVFREHLGRALAPDPGSSGLPLAPGTERQSVARIHVVLSPGGASAEPGPLEKSDQPLDLALEGEGYFVLQTPQGVRYTRDGHFQVDAAGRLAAQDGALVLGEKGPLALPKGAPTISPDGAVSVGSQEIGRLRLATFPTGADLTREGANRWASAAKPLPAAPQVRQGFLEGSNVEALEEMVQLIAAQRGFEALQQTMLAYREIDQRATELGKPVA
jgi:flagellar basal-body rod protein FlgF